MAGFQRPRPVCHLVWDLSETDGLVVVCAHCKRIQTYLPMQPNAARLCASSQDGHAQACPGYHKPVHAPRN
jgi:hypothetical protein